MMADTYENFAELKKSEPEKNYDICIENRNSSRVAIIAPHGGKIEKHTSLICKSIAGEDYSYYCFEGKKNNGNSSLHITSSNFDEPQCLRLINSCDFVIAIHGCRNNPNDGEMTYPGGLDRDLTNNISTKLEEAGFRIKSHPKFKGKDKRNICNRGKRGRGVQLEISSSLRDLLKNRPNERQRYIIAIREAIRETIRET